MRLMGVLAVFVLIAAVLAGCLEAPVDGDTGGGRDGDRVALAEDWWVNSVPSGATDGGHDHADHAHHAGLSTPNFEILGWDPLVTDQHNATVPGMMCGGVAHQDERRLSVVHSISNDMAIMVADVTDPYEPFIVGEFYMPNGVTWDADITADGRHAIAGAYPVGVFTDQGPTLPEPLVEAGVFDGFNVGAVDPIMEALGLWKPQILFRNACTGQVQEVGPENYLPFGPGIVLISLEPPEEPTLADWRPQSVVGPHSVGSHMIGDKVIVTASVTNLVHEASYYSFFEVTDTPAGSILAPYAHIQTPGIVTPVESDLAALQPWLNGHLDVWVHEHPITDQVIAYLANWDGMYVYDISNPLLPMQLAVWRPDDGEMSIHTTYPFPFLVDDKQYLIVGQEVSERADRPTGWMYILDVTDPGSPQEVGRWTLPVKPSWDDGGLQFSTHYARVLNETMFVAVNHAGLWAVDISNISEPRAYGVFVPDQPSSEPFGDHGPHIGDVDVDLHTGVITTWDGPAGVYQLRFDPDMQAPRAPAWEGAEAVEEGGYSHH